MPIINDRMPKTKRNKLTIVPKPANGTPEVIQITPNGIIARKEEADNTIPNTVISLKGLYEWAKIPLKARSITLNVWAFDTPPNLGGRSIGIPIDLNPAQANKPLTKRFRSVMPLIAK